MVGVDGMGERLTSGSGLGEALSARTAGGPDDGSDMPGHTEGPEGDDVIALATAQLRRVQTGYSGPAWLGIRMWDGIYVIGMLASAWNGGVSTPQQHPVRDSVLLTSVLSWPVYTLLGRCPRLSHEATVCGRSCNWLVVGSLHSTSTT